MASFVFQSLGEAVGGRGRGRGRGVLTGACLLKTAAILKRNQAVVMYGLYILVIGYMK